MNQANESYADSLAARRALDDKIYGVVALAIALLAFLVAIKPWSFGCLFRAFVVTFIGYLIVVILGLRAYSPTNVSVFDPHSITEGIDQPYSSLLKWTTDCLLDYTDENYKIVDRKTNTLSKMLWLFLIATLFLGIGALFY